MDKPFCPDCEKPTEVIMDHAAGDTVCVDCGLVLEAHSVDESSEWRTFSGEQSGADPNRVGDPTNPLLTDKGLTTMISKGNGKGSDMAVLGRWQNRGSNSDRNLLAAFGSIATMADRLGLVGTIKDRANEVYKKVEDLKSVRGRSQDSMIAACLYIACRQEDKPRTFKEICSVANGATKREIGRATKFIVKQLEEEMGIAMDMGTIHAADLLRRFCSHLGMNNQATRAAIETVKSIEALDIRKSPISVAAAAIYMISQISDAKLTLKAISDVAGVAEVTIRNSYKELFPHARKLLPEWFVKEEQFKNLSAF
eukprot:Gb_02337 [translate_table: standard]